MPTPLRVLILALAGAVAGCASAPEPPPPRRYVHAESAKDVLLIEVLDAAPKEKEPPTLLDYAWKTPLMVPTLAAAWIKETPRALAAVAMTPVVLVGALLDAVGLIRPEPPPPEPSPDRDR